MNGEDEFSLVLLNDIDIKKLTSLTSTSFQRDCRISRIKLVVLKRIPLLFVHIYSLRFNSDSRESQSRTYDYGDKPRAISHCNFSIASSLTFLQLFHPPILCSIHYFIFSLSINRYGTLVSLFLNIWISLYYRYYRNTVSADSLMRLISYTSRALDTHLSYSVATWNCTRMQIGQVLSSCMRPVSLIVHDVRLPLSGCSTSQFDISSFEKKANFYIPVKYFHFFFQHKKICNSRDFSFHNKIREFSSCLLVILSSI